MLSYLVGNGYLMPAYEGFGQVHDKAKAQLSTDSLAHIDGGQPAAQLQVCQLTAQVLYGSAATCRPNSLMHLKLKPRLIYSRCIT